MSATLQFVSFDSRVNPDFWFSLSKLKLDVLQLKEEAVSICGRMELGHRRGGSEIPPILDVDRFSFNPDACKSDATSLYLNGSVCNQNTIESFKNINKSQLLEDACGAALRSSIQNGSALSNPSQHLNPFLVLTFADLKKYNFYFWFAFPAFQMPEELHLVSISQAPDHYPAPKDGTSHFAVLNGETLINDLREAVRIFKEGREDVVFGYGDPCTYENNPGWPLRNYLALLLHTCPGRRNFKIYSHRMGVPSKLFELEYKGDSSSFELGSLVGWEKNENGKLGPRVASMKSAMDPSMLAESSVDLNLKLMKWRVAPDLDLQMISKLKVLLLGSGTLGCNVGRLCLGWGIRHITFVDNSKVSFSNPVRQTLFEFEDCLNGGVHKAKAASERLKSIFPGVDSQWHDIFIPMPGHPISEANLEESTRNFHELDALIQGHDIIFLLMDSRESRWLPTVMGASYGKTVLNAALGFDTFLVMRHGMHPKNYELRGKDAPIPGDELGCYFCNDVVAPGDSLKDRTLDQQCTVTRPGMSYLASGLLVELAISLMQHERKGFAPAGECSSNGESSLGGSVPHSIRGSAHNFSQFCPTTPAFDRCTACSPPVLKEFSEHKFDFVQRVCNSSSSLENITGLSQLLSDASLDDMIALGSDSE